MQALNLLHNPLIGNRLFLMQICHWGSIVTNWVFFQTMLDNILENKSNVSIAEVLLSNGALLELDNEQPKQNLSYSEFSFVVSNLVDDDIAHITADFLRHHISSLKKQRNKLHINKSLLCLCGMVGVT